MTRRATEVIWVIEHEWDLRADFRRFFGIVDPEREMSAREYFEYAVRMGAYEGVITARILQEQERQGGKTNVAATDRRNEDISVLMAVGDYVRVGGGQ